jgi:hypothetical protein
LWQEKVSDETWENPFEKPPIKLLKVQEIYQRDIWFTPHHPLDSKADSKGLGGP